MVLLFVRGAGRSSRKPPRSKEKSAAAQRAAAQCTLVYGGVDFMKKRVNTAFWVEKEKRWCIAVQKNGTRKRFYSSTPGRTGQREANAKADAWLDDSIRDGKKKVSVLYSEWVEELKLTCGTSYVTQCQRYGDCYILPTCGNIRIDELTEGDLQKAIDARAHTKSPSATPSKPSRCAERRLARAGRRKPRLSRGAEETRTRRYTLTCLSRRMPGWGNARSCSPPP